MAVIHGLHNIGVNVGHLDVSFEVVLPEKRNKRFELKQYTFLINLEIALGLLQVIHFRNQKVASS